MLSIRNIVKALPLLAKALEGSRSHLLRILHEVQIKARWSIFILTSSQFFVDDRLRKIEELVAAALNDDSSPQKVVVSGCLMILPLTL